MNSSVKCTENWTNLFMSHAWSNKLTFGAKSLMDAQNKSTRRPQVFAKANLVWIRIRTPDMKLKMPHSGPGILPEFNGNFLIQSYICDVIFMKIRSLFTALH